MTAEQTKDFMQSSEWVSIATELRPVKDRKGSGNILPFYCWRSFQFSAGNKFTCTVINFADPGGKVPLVRIVIKGYNEWKGEHPIAIGAYCVDYIADEAYEVTPLHQGFADSVNLVLATNLNKWEVNVMQDIKGKAFPAFGLIDGQIMWTMIWSMRLTTCCLWAASMWMEGLLIQRKTGLPTCKFH